ncbi:MAG: glycosyltransferase [Candidatus Krumholzibacteria bacterium]|nr:glycosyltransferase [Candidatus Krumholzibacteria bacterium]MDH5270492.1 glycosyltransferase [Candidatus Krumholzibacteria bacterium]
MNPDLISSTPATAATEAPPGAARPGRVLIAASSLRVGAAEVMTVSLANALAGEGIEVFLASADGALRGDLDARVRYLPTDNPHGAPSRVTHELLLYIKHHKFDVVHAQGASSAMLAALAARASHLRPVRVLTHHSRIFRRAPRRVSGAVMRRCADRFIAINRDKQLDLESLGIRPEQISLIPGFVDVDAIATRAASAERGPTLRDLGIPEGARVLMMSGRVLASRRFDNFVRIVAEVARREADREVHGLVVGEGPDLDEVRRVAVREEAPGHIHFLGMQRDPLAYLAASDVVIDTSEAGESLPMFLIEACAAGKPIVCSDIPAHREIIDDGETGCIVNAGIGEYAHAVTELLAHPETGAVYAHAAQQGALRRFDRHVVARATLDVYRNLLAAKSA